MYIDPNTGGMLFQILAALFALLSGVILFFSGKIRMFFAQVRRRFREASIEASYEDNDHENINEVEEVTDS
jgi:hypothetical protein